MDEFEKFFADDGFFSIEADLMDLKEETRIQNIIQKLYIYDNNPQELTKIYTDVLEDDNVAFILLKISQDMIFKKHFPEFYVVNEYGENLFNCQQNSPYHKYDVFKHIVTSIENVGNPQIPVGDWQKKLLKWTMFLHDIGKPYVKVIQSDGKDSFANHDEKSVELATGILNRFYFNDEEKNIILTLIKYHDKYLNEGEITYDNMKFLAGKLGNNKELFYLLMDVKDSDAKAKSVEVYNKYKLVKSKYIEFINTYFAYSVEKEVSVDVENEQVQSANAENKSPVINEKMTQEEMKHLIEDIISKRKILPLYQPIIDLKHKSVYGYETFTKIESSKKVDIMELFSYAKDIGRYEKMQQTLLVNGIDDFSSILSKESDFIFVNSDLESYNKYINKPRLYDYMAKNKVVLEFHNYDKKDINNLKDTIDTIHKNRGLVALDNFGLGSLSIDDLNVLDIDYIVPDRSFVVDIVNDNEKRKYINELVTYSISRDIKMIAIGVENLETLQLLNEIGVRYVQGYYFGVPNNVIDMINDKLKVSLTNDLENII